MILRRFSTKVRRLVFALGTGCLFGIGTCVQSASDTLDFQPFLLPAPGLGGGGEPVISGGSSSFAPSSTSTDFIEIGRPGPLVR